MTLDSIKVGSINSHRLNVIELMELTLIIMDWIIVIDIERRTSQKKYIMCHNDI